MVESRSAQVSLGCAYFVPDFEPNNVNKVRDTGISVCTCGYRNTFQSNVLSQLKEVIIHKKISMLMTFLPANPMRSLFFALVQFVSS